MISTLLAVTAFAGSAFSGSAFSGACPTLAGDYMCLTSFSTKSEPWSLTQTVNSAGASVYSFENKVYIADGVSRLDPNVGYSLSVRATCSGPLVIDEVGDLDDRGQHIHFTNQNVLEMNAKDQLVSRYSHEGTLIDTMVCTRR
jgi:hypothetical protein